MLCNHHPYLVPKRFHHLKNKNKKKQNKKLLYLLSCQLGAGLLQEAACILLVFSLCLSSGNGKLSPSYASGLPDLQACPISLFPLAREGPLLLGLM